MHTETKKRAWKVKFKCGHVFTMICGNPKCKKAALEAAIDMFGDRVATVF